MNQLRAMSAFVAVVERGSFAAAADNLGLSRTAVSKLVMDLESHLGVTLLNRTTRRLSLTTVGTGYFERARAVLEEVAEADNEAASETRRPKGRLRVSAPMSFGIRHLAPRLKRFFDEFPDISIDMTLNDRLVDLVDEGFDLTVRIGQLADSSLVGRTLAKSRLRLCASHHYLRTHGTPAHPDELSKHNCLGYPYWSGHDRWRLFDAAGTAITVPIRYRLWCNNGDALQAAAESGLGIVFQPDFIAYDALCSGSLTEILPGFRGPEVGVHVLYGRGGHMPLRVRTFIDYLVDSFAQDTPWLDA